MRKQKVLRIGTNYFKHPLTWVKRALGFSLIIIFVTYLELTYPGGLFWKGFLLFVSGLYFALMPKDDLAIDDEYLYHLKRSILPFFSRTDKYKISRIKSLGIGGANSTEFEIQDILGSGFSNSLEITFKDNSSRILNLRIYKEDLVFIASKVKELMKVYDDM